MPILDMHYSHYLVDDNEYYTNIGVFIQPKFSFYLEDIVKYLKNAGYKWIKITKYIKYIKIKFACSFECDNDVRDMMKNIYRDFEFVLSVLQNEKKILKYYLKSSIRNQSLIET